MCARVCGQGVSLAQAKDKGQLIFLEGLQDSLSVLIPPETSTARGAMDFLRFTHTFSVPFSSLPSNRLIRIPVVVRVPSGIPLRA